MKHALFLFAALLAIASLVGAENTYLIRRVTVFTGKTIAVSSDTTFNVAIPRNAAGTAVVPTAGTPRPLSIVWTFGAKHLSRSTDSTAVITVGILADGNYSTLADAASSVDSLKVRLPWSATEAGTRYVSFVTPAVGDTMRVRIWNPHPVLPVTDMSLRWAWYVKN